MAPPKAAPKEEANTSKAAPKEEANTSKAAPVQVTAPDGSALVAPLNIEDFLASNALAIAAETDKYISGADDLAQSAVGIASLIPTAVIHGIPRGRHPGGPKVEAARLEKEKKTGIPTKPEGIEGLWLLELKSACLVDQHVLDDMGNPEMESDGEGGVRKKTVFVRAQKGDIVLINATHALKPYLQAATTEEVAVQFTVKGKIPVGKKGNKMWDFAIATAKPLATLNAARAALPPVTDDTPF